MVQDHVWSRAAFVVGPKDNRIDLGRARSHPFTGDAKTVQMRREFIPVFWDPSATLRAVGGVSLKCNSILCIEVGRQEGSCILLNPLPKLTGSPRALWQRMQQPLPAFACPQTLTILCNRLLDTIAICICKSITHFLEPPLRSIEFSLYRGLEPTSRKLFYPRSISKIILKFRRSPCSTLGPWIRILFTDSLWETRRTQWGRVWQT